MKCASIAATGTVGPPSHLKRISHRPRIAAWVSLPFAVLLAGCFSNEPSEGEILSAVRQNRNQRQTLMLSHPRLNFNDPSAVEQAARFALEEAKVEKLGCSTPPGIPGLMCEFRIGLNLGDGKLTYQKQFARFLKVNGTWQIPS